MACLRHNGGGQRPSSSVRVGVRSGRGCSPAGYLYDSVLNLRAARKTTFNSGSFSSSSPALNELSPHSEFAVGVDSTASPEAHAIQPGLLAASLPSEPVHSKVRPITPFEIAAIKPHRGSLSGEKNEDDVATGVHAGEQHSSCLSACCSDLAELTQAHAISPLKRRRVSHRSPAHTGSR